MDLNRGKKKKEISTTRENSNKQIIACYRYPFCLWVLSLTKLPPVRKGKTLRKPGKKLDTRRTLSSIVTHSYRIRRCKRRMPVDVFNI